MTTDQPIPSASGEPAGGGRIVVGVDGSPGSLTALRWAIAEACAHGRRVHAVTAWHYTELGYGYSYAGAWAPAADQVGDSIAAAAGKTLEAAVAQCMPVATGDPGQAVMITTATVEGHPSQVLLDQAEGADLLVVGSRGHGGFVGLLLGSVSQHLVTHARCPTVVIPIPQHQ